MLPNELKPDPEVPASPPLRTELTATDPPGDGGLIEGPSTAQTLKSAGPPLDKPSANKAEELRASLALLFERLSETADEVTVKWRDPSLAPKEKTRREKLAEFAKDFGSLFTGIGSILTSLVIGAATVTLAIFTYNVNSKQSENTQKNLKTSALSDFSETDHEKRTVAAIRLAVYGEEALPAIKLALGVANNSIRSGAVQAAEVMYQSQPDTRPKLMKEMVTAFVDSNPHLRLGVLEFYTEAADQLSATEKQEFLNLVKNRVGADVKGCAVEPDDFLLAYATFLAKAVYPESSQLLISMIRSCPAQKEAVRIQAVNMLALVAEKLVPADRSPIVKELESLKPVVTGRLKESIDLTINRIQKSINP